MFAAMLSAILIAAGTFSVVYQKQVRDRIRSTFESKMATSPTPRPRGPEMSLAQAIRIKTPDGELTIPKGARVRVIEKTTLGTVAVNYQGYTAAVPSDALIPVVP